MNAKIKESCPCGAILEFEESFEWTLDSQAAKRQAEFQIAHAECRFKEALN